MQSKLGSLLESLTNIVIGVFIGFICNILILPLFGYNVTLNDGFLISCIFTLVSLVRSYIIRRIYNAYTKKQIHKG